MWRAIRAAVDPLEGMSLVVGAVGEAGGDVEGRLDVGSVEVGVEGVFVPAIVAVVVIGAVVILRRLGRGQKMRQEGSSLFMGDFTGQNTVNGQRRQW